MGAAAPDNRDVNSSAPLAPDWIATQAARSAVFIVAALAFIATVAFATDPVERNLAVDGESRTYRLLVPPGTEGTHAPAFIILHGGESGAEQQERYSGFDDFAANHGLVAIYPQGIGKHWNDGRKNGQQSTADDVAFIRAMIGALTTEGVVDGKRIYAAGISNGGFMALHLACTMPESIAGIGVIAASQPADALCPSPRPMPVIFFHGTADKFVPFDGGPVGSGPGNRGAALSQADTIVFWQKENGCGPAVRSELPQKDTSNGMRVTVETYSCPPGQGLENVIIEGGGHTWPGARQSVLATMVLGPVNDDISANEMMWNFFQSQASAHP